MRISRPRAALRDVVSAYKAASDFPAEKLARIVMTLRLEDLALITAKTFEHGARQDRREGKAPSTQAGEFVREEMEHIREGKHGARSAKQAIAIGLSKARRAGVRLPLPKKGTVSEQMRRSAELAEAAGERGETSVSPARSRAIQPLLR